MPEISLAQVAQAVATIEKRVAAQKYAIEHAAAQLGVLTTAVAAVFETHPDPDALAASFRQCWQRSGLAEMTARADSASAQGIAETLAMLETLCAERLSVRPPGQAWPPAAEGLDE